MGPLVNTWTFLFHFRVEYSSLYMCKSKRGMKREDGKVRCNTQAMTLGRLVVFLHEFFVVFIDIVSL